MDQQFAEKILERIRADYDTIAASFSETRQRSYDLEPLVRDARSGETVLDIGCGNGRLLDVLPVGIRYMGCDISERMIELVKKRQVVQLPNIQFIYGDILTLPFASASFDHVFALAVLHHIPSDALRQQAVRELARVVKPGGCMSITVWNLRSFYWIKRYRLWRLFLGLHPKEYDRGDCLVPWKRGIEQPIMRYLHAFTRKELRTLFESAGFSVVKFVSNQNHTIIAEK